MKKSRAQIETAYVNQFGDLPIPIGIDEDFVLEVAEQHLEKGIAIPRDFDWYDDVPEGAVV